MATRQSKMLQYACGFALTICGLLFYSTFRERRGITDPYYSAWSPWSKCTKTCDEGVRYRIRACNMPKYSISHVKDCSRFGPEEETLPCIIRYCPVDGGYSTWSDFTQCSKTCGEGVQTRTRECSNPAPRFGGVYCTRLGPNEETKACNLKPCPVNGRYGEWGPWSECTATCGGGFHKRPRECNNPPPSNGGKDCSDEGNPEETTRCNEQECPKPEPKKLEENQTKEEKKSDEKKEGKKPEAKKEEAKQEEKKEEKKEEAKQEEKKEEKKEEAKQEEKKEEKKPEEKKEEKKPEEKKEENKTEEKKEESKQEEKKEEKKTEEKKEEAKQEEKKEEKKPEEKKSEEKKEEKKEGNKTEEKKEESKQEEKKDKKKP